MQENSGRSGTVTSHEEAGGLQTRNGRDHPDHFRAPTDLCRGPPNEFRQSDRVSPRDGFRGPSEVSQVDIHEILKCLTWILRAR